MKGQDRGANKYEPEVGWPILDPRGEKPLAQNGTGLDDWLPMGPQDWVPIKSLGPAEAERLLRSANLNHLRPANKTALVVHVGGDYVDAVHHHAWYQRREWKEGRWLHEWWLIRRSARSLLLGERGRHADLRDWGGGAGDVGRCWTFPNPAAANEVAADAAGVWAKHPGLEANPQEAETLRSLNGPPVYVPRVEIYRRHCGSRIGAVLLDQCGEPFGLDCSEVSFPVIAPDGKPLRYPPDLRSSKGKWLTAADCRLGAVIEFTDDVIATPLVESTDEINARSLNKTVDLMNALRSLIEAGGESLLIVDPQTVGRITAREALDDYDWGITPGWGLVVQVDKYGATVAVAPPGSQRHWQSGSQELVLWDVWIKD